MHISWMRRYSLWKKVLQTYQDTRAQGWDICFASLAKSRLLLIWFRFCGRLVTNIFHLALFLSQYISHNIYISLSFWFQFPFHSFKSVLIKDNFTLSATLHSNINHIISNIYQIISHTNQTNLWRNFTAKAHFSDKVICGACFVLTTDNGWR